MTTQEMNTNITNTNEPAEKKTNKKKAIGIVAVAAVTVAAVIIAMLTACGNKQPTATADEVIGTSVQTVTQVVTDSQGNTHIEEATKVVEIKQTQPAEKSEKATEAQAQNVAKTDSKQNNGGQSNSNSSGNNNNQTNLNNNSGNAQSSKTNNSSNSGQTSKNNSSSGNTNKPASNSGSSSSSQSKPSSSSGSSSSSKPEPAPATQPATKDPHEGKTWYDAEYKTEKVWVVDEEGYTWQKPIYETHDRTICNTCGADITDNVDHIFEHMDKGENGSYRNETVDTLVGYETITVPEKGHYETKTTLVRAAGWY